MFGPTNDGYVIITADQLVPLNKYFDFQEAMNYIILLHCLRMTLLIKIINKSSYLKNQERIVK